MPEARQRCFLLRRGEKAIRRGFGSKTIIATKYFAKLRQTTEVDEAKIAQLEALFANGKKIKADELVKILSSPAGSDIK